MTSSYKIALYGSTPAAIDAHFKSLTDTEPKSDPMDYAETVTLASGKTRGLGFLNQIWHWDGMSLAMRVELYNTYANKAVTVATKNNAGTFAYWDCLFIWPEKDPEYDAYHNLDVNVTLADLRVSAYTDPPP